jgi:hypothetical protein
MLTIVRMQRDVLANQRGELAGFSPERTHELLKSNAVEVICTFDTATHRFNPVTEMLEELPSPN